MPDSFLPDVLTQHLYTSGPADLCWRSNPADGQNWWDLSRAKAEHLAEVIAQAEAARVPS